MYADKVQKYYKHILMECEYWRKILKKVVATIKFLSSQGLAFRGRDKNLKSKHKGNYLSCLVYLSEFDSFLAEHLKNCGHKGKGNISYISHQVCDEFIVILENQLIKSFFEEVKTARGFSQLLERCNATSKTLQDPTLNLSDAVNLL